MHDRRLRCVRVAATELAGAVYGAVEGRTLSSMSVDGPPCEECKRRFSEPTVVTPTGRKLCPRCANDEELGTAAAIITGTGVEGAVSITGWMRRARKAMRKR